jgi:hypothetical protein
MWEFVLGEKEGGRRRWPKGSLAYIIIIDPDLFKKKNKKSLSEMVIRQPETVIFISKSFF